MSSADVPEPRPELFASLAGEVVAEFCPFTEASPVAIAAQFIIMFGNAVGSSPRFYVGETAHRTNEYLMIGGTTSRARKGDSGNIALRVLEEADPDWARHRCKSGLSSGEGLIYNVRDRVMRRATEGKNAGQDVVTDEGVDDKRLLAYETEATAVLKQTDRKGNTLSNITRDGWDHRQTLSTLTRNNPLTATNPHISIIGHCTDEDLRAHISDTEVANGWANRFLFAKVHRAQRLPSPGRADERGVTVLCDRVRDALEFARGLDEMTRTPTAERLWCAAYDDLTADHPGLLGKLSARAEAHVVRLSMLFSLFRHCREIDEDALRSALAFWDYCFESIRLIFGDRTGNNDADRLLGELTPDQGMTFSDIRDELFSGHISSTRLQTAVDLLVRLGEVSIEKKETGGRPRVVVTRLTSEERKKRWKSSESRNDDEETVGDAQKSEESQESGEAFFDDAREWGT